MATFTKTEDNKLKVTNEFYYPDGSTYTQDNSYDRQFLENQVVSIQKQRDEMNAIRDKELLEVQTLLLKCDELNVTLPVVETPIINV